MDHFYKYWDLYLSSCAEHHTRLPKVAVSKGSNPNLHNGLEWSMQDIRFILCKVLYVMVNGGLIVEVPFVWRSYPFVGW